MGFAFGDRRLPERFWEKVWPSPDGCWVWLASVTNGGYSRFGYWGTTALGHRVAYVELVGSIPPDREIDHLCRNTRCVNPAHLDVVTHVENMRRCDIGARQREKTHCDNGHRFTTETTRISPKTGHRTCRTCAADRQRARRRNPVTRDSVLAYDRARVRVR